MVPKKKKTAVKKSSPKKKAISASPQKKETLETKVKDTKSSKADALELTQNKSGVPKKKHGSDENSTLSSSDFSIYTDENLQKPLRSPGKDVIKVLTRNPYEAYIFWNIMPSTYQNAIDYFQKESTQVGLEICLEYTLPDGSRNNQRVSIHPLSQNYFCRFLGPVSHLKVSLYAVSDGNSFLIFDSSAVSLPEDKPADVWDEEWIHPDWISKGYLRKSEDGRYYLAKGIQVQELVESTIPQGASGFLGSSGLGGSSGMMGSSGRMGSSENHTVGLGGDSK